MSLTTTARDQLAVSKVTDPATTVRARALRAAARVVATYPVELLADSHDGAVVEVLDAVLALAAHPAWQGAADGTQLGEIGRRHAARLIDNAADDGALWALLHHPDASPCTTTHDEPIVPARVPGLTVCSTCAASLVTAGRLGRHREPSTLPTHVSAVR